AQVYPRSEHAVADEAVVALVVVPHEDGRGHLAMNPALRAEGATANESSQDSRLGTGEDRPLEPSPMAHLDPVLEDDGPLSDIEDYAGLDRRSATYDPARVTEDDAALGNVLRRRVEEVGTVRLEDDLERSHQIECSAERESLDLERGSPLV